MKALAEAVRAYIDSEDEDRIEEFDAAMEAALVAAERAWRKKYGIVQVKRSE